MLGNVDVLDDAGPVAIGGPRQRLLLATLLASRRQVVALDSLTDALWGDDPPPTARSTLQTSVSKLRRLIASSGAATLDSRPPGYLLDVPPDAVDADRFELDLHAARAVLDERPADAIALLDRALGCWVGSAFAGFEDLPWVRPEAVRLEELRLQAVEDRNDRRLVLGDTGAVISELEGLTRAEPLRERLWRLLMVALHRSGRQAEALRVAAEFRRHLREELGLNPSPAFTDGERAILDPTTTPGAPPDSRRDAPPMAPAPVLVGGLVGRDAALRDVEVAVRRARLVTLTGPGGVGKSAMANEVARRMGSSFRDGVRLVELAPVSDPAAVAAAAAQSVHAERRSGRSLTNAVVDVLGPQELLFVVDNCEHVIETAAGLIGELIRWCPSVTILATSREPIGIAGEVVQLVAPLEVPMDPSGPLEEIAATPSVEVFVARAAESSLGFTLTGATASAVAELCIQLDGLPLALELAAARMSSMTPRQLADRLTERFALLGSGYGRAERHRTLLDVVQWSYGLLDATERTLFARLSVFSGGFDLDAAERTCGGGGLRSEGVAGVLGGLVDKSLVVASRTDDQFRYSQLETLRRFGAERLADQPGGPLTHRAHLTTFLDRAVTGGVALDGPDEGIWSTRLHGDMDNMRTALATAIAVDDAESALGLVVSMSEAGFRSIRYEVVGWAETVAAMDAAELHPLRPTALAVVAYGAFVRGELDRAVQLAERAIELRGSLGVDSCGLPERVLGNARFYQGHRDEAMEWIAQMVEVTRAVGRTGRLAHALYMRSVAQTSIGDPEGGARLAEDAHGVSVATGSATAMSQAAYASGLAAAHHDPDEGLRLLEHSAELADSVGNRWMRSFASTEAMWLRARRGELEAALAGYREIVDTWFRGGDWANQWLSLRHVAGVLAAAGRDEDAALLTGAVQAAGAAAALPFALLDADELAELRRGLADRLGDEALATAGRRGASMRDDAAVALALGAIESLLVARTE